MREKTNQQKAEIFAAFELTNFHCPIQSLNEVIL